MFRIAAAASVLFGVSVIAFGATPFGLVGDTLVDRVRAKGGISRVDTSIAGADILARNVGKNTIPATPADY